MTGDPMGPLTLTPRDLSTSVIVVAPWAHRLPPRELLQGRVAAAVDRQSRWCGLTRRRIQGQRGRTMSSGYAPGPVVTPSTTQRRTGMGSAASARLGLRIRSVAREGQGAIHPQLGDGQHDGLARVEKKAATVRGAGPVRSRDEDFGLRCGGTIQLGPP